MGVDYLAKFSGGEVKESLDPANTGPCFRLANKPPRYIVFHDKDGNPTAVAYSLLQSLAFNPPVIILRFSCGTVTLTGENLKPAFQSLIDHLVQDCSWGDERYREEAGLPFVSEIKFDFK